MIFASTDTIQERLYFLQAMHEDNPANPDIFRGAFRHVAQLATGLSVVKNRVLRNEEELGASGINFGILGYGVNWPGFDYGLILRAADNEFLTPAEETIWEQSSEYRETVQTTLAPIDTIAQHYKTIPGQPVPWLALSNIIKQNIRATGIGSAPLFIEKARKLNWKPYMNIEV